MGILDFIIIMFSAVALIGGIACGVVKNSREKAVLIIVFGLGIALLSKAVQETIYSSVVGTNVLFSGDCVIRWLLTLFAVTLLVQTALALKIAIDIESDTYG